jgi:serine/threonine-protein kinase RsbW
LASPDPVFERSLRTIGTVEQLPETVAFLHQAWQDGALPEEAAFPFDLALDEVFMNVVRYAAGPDGEPREVTIVIRREGEIVSLVVEDDGPAFDPLTVPAPDVTASIEDRPIGGLGVFLVRRLMDDVAYARVSNRNRLTMRKAVA